MKKITLSLIFFALVYTVQGQNNRLLYTFSATSTGSYSNAQVLPAQIDVLNVRINGVSTATSWSAQIQTSPDNMTWVNCGVSVAATAGASASGGACAPAGSQYVRVGVTAGIGGGSLTVALMGTCSLCQISSSHTAAITGGTITNATITGGTIDGTVIGGATPAAGTFTILTAGTGTQPTALTVNGNSNSLLNGLVNIQDATSTATLNYGINYLSRNLPAGGTIAHILGKSNTNGNSLVLLWNQTATANTNNWCLSIWGNGATCTLQGFPTNLLKSAHNTLDDGLGNMSLGGTINNYGGVPTVAAGIAPIYAQVNLTGQTGAIATTTIYNVPASGAGLYRVWVDLMTTTVGTLGSVSVNVFNNNGLATNNQLASNLVLLTTGGSEGSASFMVYSAASQPITFTTTPSGNAAGAYQYAIRIRLEYMG